MRFEKVNSFKEAPVAGLKKERPPMNFWKRGSQAAALTVQRENAMGLLGDPLSIDQSTAIVALRYFGS